MKEFEECGKVSSFIELVIDFAEFNRWFYIIIIWILPGQMHVYYAMVKPWATSGTKKCPNTELALLMRLQSTPELTY